MITGLFLTKFSMTKRSPFIWPNIDCYELSVRNFCFDDIFLPFSCPHPSLYSWLEVHQQAIEYILHMYFLIVLLTDAPVNNSTRHSIHAAWSKKVKFSRLLGWHELWGYILEIRRLKLWFSKRFNRQWLFCDGLHLTHFFESIAPCVANFNI